MLATAVLRQPVPAYLLGSRLREVPRVLKGFFAGLPDLMAPEIWLDRNLWGAH